MRTKETDTHMPPIKQEERSPSSCTIPSQVYPRRISGGTKHMSKASNAQQHKSTADPWAVADASTSPTYASFPKRSNNITPKRKEHVPDAWDDDEDEAGDVEGESEREVDNATLWRDADAKQPMPEVILTASSGSSAAAFPPAAALQQPIRILKRPSAPSPTSRTPSFSDGGSGSATLKGREAEYQAARARIFGLDSTASGPANSGSENNGSSTGNEGVNRTSDLQATQTRIKPTASIPASNTSSTAKPITLLSTTSTSVLRNPRGPPPTSSSDTSASTNSAQKGFNRRRNGGSASGSRRSHDSSGSHSTTTS